MKTWIDAAVLNHSVFTLLDTKLASDKDCSIQQEEKTSDVTFLAKMSYFCDKVHPENQPQGRLQDKSAPD